MAKTAQRKAKGKENMAVLEINVEGQEYTAGTKRTWKLRDESEVEEIEKKRTIEKKLKTSQESASGKVVEAS